MVMRKKYFLNRKIFLIEIHTLKIQRMPNCAQVIKACIAMPKIVFPMIV